MTEAQRVVDTFAPFVGTEGLRGVVSISVCDRHEITLSVGTETQGRTDVVRPHIAHGFLLSRLAEELALLDYTFYPGAEGGGRVVASSPDGEALGNGTIDSFDDYPSAILAAARVEWPKRDLEAKGRLEILPPETINLNGVVYRRESGC